MDKVTSLAEVWIEIKDISRPAAALSVTSLAEVSIEIQKDGCQVAEIKVTSLAEVWIEIYQLRFLWWSHQSLPLRKCGLKFQQVHITSPAFYRHFPCGSVD